MWRSRRQVIACGPRWADLTTDAGNAARNILAEGRKVAAGLADTRNACRGDVRREPALAVAIEAGTHRSVA